MSDALAIRDLINGWDDIISLSKSDPAEYELRPKETKDELAYRKLKLIAKVYNQGDVRAQFFPWFQIINDESKESGFALQCGGQGHANAGTTVGILLCYVKFELCKDAGDKFPEIFTDFLIRQTLW